MFKKILSAILVVSMILTLSVSLFSCKEKEGNKDNTQQGNNDQNGENTQPEKILYTVTVVDEEGNPIKNVKLDFNPKGGITIPFPTDKDGKAAYKTDKELTVTVKEIPNGYSYDKLNVEQKFGGDNTLTVTLITLAPFVIRVVDQNSNPIEGVLVQMCDEAGSCRMPTETDAKGEATYRYEEGNFHAQLTSIPDGYSVENPDEYYNFVNGVATITLTKN